MEKEILFYRNLYKKELEKGKNKFQLILCAGDISLVLGTYRYLQDMEEVVNKYFPPGTKLERFPENMKRVKKPSFQELDNVYLPLQGDAPRGLSWGMSRKKVARAEQIDGGKHVLLKHEHLHGFEITIQFGFDEWAHCGLEYIAYSSPKREFFGVMQKELNQIYSAAEQVVDYYRLDWLLQGDKIKDEETLIRYIKTPEAAKFSRFINSLQGLTFRSALKWTKDHTACLMYNKRKDSLGERNKHNHSHVVEFWPSILFDFYQERFAELYLPI